MQFDTFRDLCLAKPGATEGTPFGPDVLVFKAVKMFALVNLDGPPFRANLKCDPERAVDLRERYDGIIPGYHMNKQHWNTVALVEDVPGELIRELLDHSYDLIVASLKKADRERLSALND